MLKSKLLAPLAVVVIFAGNDERSRKRSARGRGRLLRAIHVLAHRQMRGRKKSGAFFVDGDHGEEIELVNRTQNQPNRQRVQSRASARAWLLDQLEGPFGSVGPGVVEPLSGASTR